MTASISISPQNQSARNQDVCFDILLLNLRPLRESTCESTLVVIVFVEVLLAATVLFLYRFAIARRETYKSLSEDGEKTFSPLSPRLGEHLQSWQSSILDVSLAASDVADAAKKDIAGFLLFEK
jgi:hypothetical protein